MLGLPWDRAGGRCGDPPLGDAEIPATLEESVSTNPFLVGKGRPVVVGHRGVPLLHQENTLAGFRRAVELGLPAVELDVRLTADRKAVCVHDSTLQRLCGFDKPVVETTWDELAKLRVRRDLAVGGGRTIHYQREEKIPLLADVLSEVGGKLAINVELKLDFPKWWHLDVSAVVADVIARAGVDDRVIVTSFDPRKLRAVGRVRPNLAFGFCFDDRMLDFASALLDRLPRFPHKLSDRRHFGANGRRLLNWLLDTNLAGWLLGTRVVGAEHTLVGAETVDRLHRQNVAIGTHTMFPIGATTKPEIASSRDEVERLCSLGVDWIESDDPERLQTLVHAA